MVVGRWLQAVPGRILACVFIPSAKGVMLTRRFEVHQLAPAGTRTSPAPIDCLEFFLRRLYKVDIYNPRLYTSWKDVASMTTACRCGNVLEALGMTTDATAYRNKNRSRRSPLGKAPSERLSLRATQCHAERDSSVTPPTPIPQCRRPVRLP